jgi:arylsulfatase A-like enzyme
MMLRDPRTTHLGRLTAGAAMSVLLGVLGSRSIAAEAAARPVNFVIILVDDLGWMDLSCQGSKYYETPQIDRLAAQGMRFTNGYAACAVCSPTRAGIQTGRYPARLGVTDWIRARFQGGEIPADGKNPTRYVSGPNQALLCPPNALFMELSELTLAEALKPAGYVSCHVGKWHLGQQDQFPEKQGYDENHGGCDLGQPPGYFDPYQSKQKYYAIPNLPPRKKGEYLTDREADEAVAFIRANGDKPFLLNMCHYCVHTPLQAKKEVIAKYQAKPKTNQKNAVYAAMVESVDDAAGKVMAALDELGLAERTVVIFTSDNGGLLGSTDNAPLRSGKGFPYEGGIRVPLVVRWPGVVEAGSTCDVPASSIDFFPTLLEIAGVPLPKDRPIDGVSLLPVLKQTGGLKRDALYWHFPHYRVPRGPYSIIRSGDWKLIKWYQGDEFELFNLADDLGETKDFSQQMPEKVRQLDQQLTSWLKSTGAKLPRPNPAYTGKVLRKPKSAAARPLRRPNVLWLIGEDMCADLGCYGTAQVWTPNLDRLAAQGVRYTRAFTTAPVCSASRSAFMTGMYQTTIGAHNHRSHRDDGYRLPDGVRLLTDWLRDAGYFTANIRQVTKELRGTGKTDWNFTPEGKPYDTDRWDELKRHQPFYAQINFSEAHRGDSWPAARRDNPRLADPSKAKLPPYYPDHPIARDDWANYLDAITALDRKVGVVLKKLEEDGLADDTVVVFFGDHGRCMVRGKQWCYDSGLGIPLIIRWPKNFPPPPRFKPGSVDGRLIAAIDLAATTLAIAGVRKPPKMQGQVFLGPDADPARQYVFGARDRCDETVFRIRTVRDRRYRYIRNFMPERPFLQINRYKEASYPMIPLMRKLHAEGKLNATQAVLLAPSRPAEELYDLEHDPYEIHNLVQSPEHQAVLRRLRDVLDEWIDESRDQGRTPEPPEIVQAWEDTMKRNYDARLRQLGQQGKD